MAEAGQLAARSERPLVGRTKAEHASYLSTRRASALSTSVRAPGGSLASAAGSEESQALVAAMSSRVLGAAAASGIA